MPSAGKSAIICGPRADVLELPSEDGRTTKDLIQQMIDKAKELSVAPNSFFADQFNNPDAASGYESMAEEIWDQSGQNIDAFVQSVGTAQCITGVAAALREKQRRIHIVAVEPSESPVLTGGAPGPHKIEGVGPGFIPPIWTDNLADEIIQISTSEAKDMARRLVRKKRYLQGHQPALTFWQPLRSQLGWGPAIPLLRLPVIQV